jgi:FkbM family methyltransferase
LTNERFVSYAQNMEDVMLWRALHQTVDGPGFYIDAGASDPTVLSVTRAFYDRGWRGINIEPLPEQAALLRRERPRDVTVEAALSDRAETSVSFHRVTQSRQTGLSTSDAAEAEHHRDAGAVVETIEVRMTTLADVCRQHVDGPVHFLKVDVEGSEAAVLAGADFRAFRPWIVLVEATQPLEADSADLGWEAPLLAAGYRHVWFDGLNRFYLADEHAALVRHFQVPPNVFDNYCIYDPPLQDHLAAVTALSERRAQVMGEMEADIAELRRALAKMSAVAAPAPEPAVPATPAVPPPAPRHSAIRRMARRAGLPVYRLLRPVVRPLVWRFRSFMIGPLQQEMFENRIRLDNLMAQANPTALGPQQAMVAVMERALMTLALENAREPQSLLVTPKAANPAPDCLPKSGAAR